MTPGAGRLAALLLLAGCHTASEWVEVPRDAAVGAEVPSLDRGVTVDQGAADAGPAPVDRPTADLGFDTGPAPVDRPAVDLGVDAGPAPVDRGPVVLGPDPVSFTGTLPAVTGRGTGTLTVGGQAREVLVYVPSSRGASPPLLVLFHGTNDTAGAIFSESAAQRVANDHGVVVVAPLAVYQGVSDWDHPDSEGRWWETYPSVNPDTNRDLLLLRAVLVAAQRAYAVDPARIYLLGHSNGAFFAQLAANTVGERIAAWASSSGGLCNCPTRPDCTFTGRGTSCASLAAQSGWCACSGPDKPGPIRTAGRRPPAYLTHGSSDDIVTPYFTCALASRLSAAGFEVETVMRDGDLHVMPDAFAVTVWPWLFRHRRE
jgi:poly(3-hydroxybutyrate) depolymerase